MIVPHKYLLPCVAVLVCSSQLAHAQVLLEDRSVNRCDIKDLNNGVWITAEEDILITYLERTCWHMVVLCIVN